MRKKRVWKNKRITVGMKGSGRFGEKGVFRICMWKGCMELVCRNKWKSVNNKTETNTRIQEECKM